MGPIIRSNARQIRKSAGIWAYFPNFNVPQGKAKTVLKILFL